MPRAVPSQVVSFIDQVFPWAAIQAEGHVVNLTLGNSSELAGLVDLMAALQLRNGTQDGKDHLAGRGRRFELLRQAHKLDAKRLERLQRPQQVVHRASEPVEFPDYHGIEPTPGFPGRSGTSQAPRPAPPRAFLS